MFKSKLSFSNYFPVSNNIEKNNIKNLEGIKKNIEGKTQNKNKFPLFWTCYKDKNGQWKCPLDSS